MPRSLLLLFIAVFVAENYGVPGMIFIVFLVLTVYTSFLFIVFVAEMIINYTLSFLGYFLLLFRCLVLLYIRRSCLNVIVFVHVAKLCTVKILRIFGAVLSKKP